MTNIIEVGELIEVLDLDGGVQGLAGTAATIEVGNVTSGDTPSVTNVGTTTAAILDFVLAKGDQGEQGYAPLMQYSEDGVSWHDDYVGTDLYIHFSMDNGATWGDTIQIATTAFIKTSMHMLDPTVNQDDITKELSLAWWIAYFNGAEATIRVSRGTHQVTADMTVPENICLKFDKGAILEVANTKTLTINGAIEAGLWQIFGGLGSITGTPNVAEIYPEWFGAKGDGVADDYTALQTSVTFGLTAKCPVKLASKTYKHGTTLQLIQPDSVGQINSAVLASPGSCLYFTGTGIAVEAAKRVTPEADATYIFKYVLGGENPLSIKGNSNCTIGALLAGLDHSDININVRDCTTNAVEIQGSVSSIYKIIVSANESAFIVQPTTGIVLDNLGTAGAYSCNNTFINTIIEGVSGAGIDIKDGRQNSFLGGTSEGNGKGINIDPGCTKNSFKDMWFEMNTVADVETQGAESFFENCHAQSSSSSNTCYVGGDNCTFIGGYWRTIEFASNSSHCKCINVASSSNASLGFKGAGVYKTYGCVYVDVTGAIETDSPLGAVCSKVIEVTHDISVAAGQSYTGTGFKPSSLIVFYTNNNGNPASWGMSMVDSNRVSHCVYSTQVGTPPEVASHTHMVFIYNGSGSLAAADLLSYDADGFTINWTKAGTPTGTVTLKVLALR